MGQTAGLTQVDLTMTVPWVRHMQLGSGPEVSDRIHDDIESMSPNTDYPHRYGRDPLREPDSESSHDSDLDSDEDAPPAS